MAFFGAEVIDVAEDGVVKLEWQLRDDGLNLLP